MTSKSSWPLCPGPHTCYNGVHRANLERELEEIAEITPQFRLEAATRLHEVGILASNRGISYAAVNVFLSLVHTARQVMGAGNGRSRHTTVVSTPGSVTGTKS